MTPPPIADIHAHPSFLPWNAQENPSQLWTPHPPRWNQHRWKITTYAQSDFTTMARGNVRLLWTSLYPLERGFVPDARLLGSKRLLTRVGQTLLRTSKERLRFFRSEDYDYFDSLQGEYEFFAAGENLAHDISSNQGEEPWSYTIGRDIQHVNETLESPQRIAVVLTIEGAHAFGSVHPARPPKTEDVLDRVDRVLGSWDHPVFCVTFCHHFQNALCGHARSIYAPIHRIFDQSDGLDTGFTEMGRAVLDRILDLDQKHRPDRIPTRIDLKHMSLAGRWELYQRIEDHNRAHPDNPVPLLVSHFAASGNPKTIPDILASPHDSDQEYASTPGVFNPWTINFCDEEILRIHQSGGLLGLILEQRILASKRELRRVRSVPEKKYGRPNPEFNRAWGELLLNHIRQVITVCRDARKSWYTRDPQSAWDLLALGTDYDGKINVTDAFPTSEQLPQLERTLVELLDQAPDRDDLLLGLDPDRAARKIVFENTRSFLDRHFRTVPIR
ncbi:MAG: hypothetical protein QF752_10165 [Planctomycetota bacterium]|jgi:hypothetical protein|nr:hypothetical protein [Planctomycetota bacterium]